jgi:hypothetical protein
MVDEQQSVTGAPFFLHSKRMAGINDLQYLSIFDVVAQNGGQGIRMHRGIVYIFCNLAITPSSHRPDIGAVQSPEGKYDLLTNTLRGAGRSVAGMC